MVAFSDILYKNSNLIDSLYNALTENGVMVMQEGEDDSFNEPPYTHWKDDQTLSVLQNLKDAGFQTIIEYSEGHAGFGSPWAYKMIFKNDAASRPRWFANEAEVNLAIRKRILPRTDGGSSLRYFDGSIMKTFQFPSRITEALWCRTENPGDCRHGFNPEVPNVVAADASDERPSSYHYVDLEQCVSSSLHVPQPTLSVASRFIGPSIMRFKNEILTANEHIDWSSRPALKKRQHNPFFDRHFPPLTCRIPTKL